MCTHVGLHTTTGGCLTHGHLLRNPCAGTFHSSSVPSADHPEDGAPGRTAERAGAAGERIADRLSGVHDSVAGRGFNIPEEGAGGRCH